MNNANKKVDDDVVISSMRPTEEVPLVIMPRTTPLLTPYVFRRGVNTGMACKTCVNRIARKNELCASHRTVTAEETPAFQFTG